MEEASRWHCNRIGSGSSSSGADWGCECSSAWILQVSHCEEKLSKYFPSQGFTQYLFLMVISLVNQSPVTMAIAHSAGIGWLEELSSADTAYDLQYVYKTTTKWHIGSGSDSIKLTCEWCLSCFRCTQCSPVLVSAVDGRRPFSETQAASLFSRRRPCDSRSTSSTDSVLSQKCRAQQ